MIIGDMRMEIPSFGTDYGQGPDKLRPCRVVYIHPDHGIAMCQEAADALENQQREIDALQQIIEKQSGLNQKLADMALELDQVKAEREAYKSTGLEPDQIKGLMGTVQFYFEKLSPVTAAEFARFSIDRLLGLIQAEKDGRQGGDD